MLGGRSITLYTSSRRGIFPVTMFSDSDAVLLMAIQHTKFLLCITLVNSKMSRMKLAYHLFGMSATTPYGMLI